MRKIVAIPLLIIYLLAVSGVIVSAHFCGTELASWNVYTENDGCTNGDCGDEDAAKHTCCDDKVITAKVSQDQNHQQAFQLKLAPADLYIPAAPFYIASQETIPEQTKGKTPYSSNAPPGRWQNIPLFKLHSRFTYYG